MNVPTATTTTGYNFNDNSYSMPLLMCQSIELLNKKELILTNIDFSVIIIIVNNDINNNNRNNNKVIMKKTIIIK